MSFYNLVVLVVSMEVFAGSIGEPMNFSLPWVPGGGLIAVFLLKKTFLNHSIIQPGIL